MAIYSDPKGAALRQEEMRERMKRKYEKKSKSSKHKKTEEELELEQELKEIIDICLRTDLVCPYCRVNGTNASRRTGQVLPCVKCCNKRIQLRKYNMTLKQFWNMYRSQDGKCAVCDTVMDPPHVDHCHELHHVRGLLCAGCNTGLGSFKDDPTRLLNAIKYLENNILGSKWKVQDVTAA